MVESRLRRFSKKEFLKLVSYSSRALEHAERACGYSTLLFCDLLQQRQSNEQRTITHAYTAIVLRVVAVAVAVAVKLCLVKLPKTE